VSVAHLLRGVRWPPPPTGPPTGPAPALPPSSRHEPTAADVRMEAVLEELQAIRKLLERIAG
jgi:hypothetical protein